MIASFAIRNAALGIRHSLLAALRGIDADFKPENADTFRRILHPDLRADYVLANPPFNDFGWFRNDDDPALRDWQFGVPPKGNANFAWVQHFIYQPYKKENNYVV